MSTRRITGMAVMAAMSIILVSIPFLRIQPFPIAPFLEYDAADIPIILATFIYGPMSGLIVTVIVSVIQGLAFSFGGGPIGILMHIISTGAFVLTGGVLFKYIKKSKLPKIASLVISLVVGVIGLLIAAISSNLLLTPIFMGVPLEGVLEILLPAIIPFNLLSSGINSTIAGIIYILLGKSIEQYTIFNHDITKSDLLLLDEHENKSISSLDDETPLPSSQDNHIIDINTPEVIVSYSEERPEDIPKTDINSDN